MNLLKKLFIRFTLNKKTDMEAEIYSQPDIIFDLIRKYIKKDYTLNIDMPENIKKVALIASGSSYHSAAIAANFLRHQVHCDAQSYYASEVALTENIDVDTETLYVFISQSGETKDTNISLSKIRIKTDKTLAITNTKNSSLYKNCKYKMLTYAGLEKAIASTKAMCAQMFCLFLISAKIMQQKELPSIQVIDELLNVPEYINNALHQVENIKHYSESLVNYDNAAILASGMFYPLAKEGALKIKETSYINTTAYPTGEFLHGHIAILNKKCAVISLVNNHNVQFTIDVLNKINSTYKTDSLIITALPLSQLTLSNVIEIPAHSDINFLFSSLIIFQLLAYYSALLLNRNIDAPEGLQKIVK